MISSCDVEEEKKLNVKTEESFVRYKIGSVEKLRESHLHCITETPAGHYIFHCSNSQNIFVFSLYTLLPQIASKPLKIHRMNMMRNSYQKDN